MVVVDQGKRAIGRTIEVTVTSVLQTTAGKMIFCRWPEANAAAQAEGDGRRDRRDPRNGREYRGEPRRESDRREATERHPAPSRRAPRAGPGPPPRPATGLWRGSSRDAVGRALVFLLVQAPLALLLTAGYGAAACVAALADRSGRSTREIGGAWSRVLLRLFRVQVRVSGLEHAPPGPPSTPPTTGAPSTS